MCDVARGVKNIGRTSLRKVELKNGGLLGWLRGRWRIGRRLNALCERCIRGGMRGWSLCRVSMWWVCERRIWRMGAGRCGRICRLGRLMRRGIGPGWRRIALWRTRSILQCGWAMGDGRLGGTLSLMRITPAAGTIEAGWLTFAPRLQRSREATEAIYLLMKWAFEAGYRRFEWKCDAANIPSRRAAERFGLSFEGVFRQAGVVKGRNRDTAWFAAIDGEWPALHKAFEAWLRADNFDACGQQRQSLRALTAPILVSVDSARD